LNLEDSLRQRVAVDGIVHRQPDALVGQRAVVLVDCRLVEKDDGRAGQQIGNYHAGRLGGLRLVGCVGRIAADQDVDIAGP
jgi:hypothetical protein